VNALQRENKDARIFGRQVLSGETLGSQPQGDSISLASSTSPARPITRALLVSFFSRR
jgi:hypothetical protein